MPAVKPIAILSIALSIAAWVGLWAISPSGCGASVPASVVVALLLSSGAAQCFPRGELKAAIFIALLSVSVSGYAIYTALAHPHL